MEKPFRILWDRKNVSGSIEVHNAGKTVRQDFDAVDGTAVFTVTDPALLPGPKATVITVRTDEPFSFFLRDVSADAPVYVAEYQVIVTASDDVRNYDELLSSIKAGGRRDAVACMEEGPEESFDNAAAHTRNMPCNMWMGLSRDIRMFECETNTLENPFFCWDRIQPFFHHDPVTDEEVINEPLSYHYFAGRGIGCIHDIHRYLEDKVLPILNVVENDGPVQYHQTIFTTLESSELKRENVHGTDFMVSETFGAWRRERTEWEQKEIDKVYYTETHQLETTVAYLRVRAVNNADAPKYAFMRIPQPNVPHIPEATLVKTVVSDGVWMFEKTGRVFMTAQMTVPCTSEPGELLNADNIEYSVLLKPGEHIDWIFKIFHEPVDAKRAVKLLETDFDAKLRECKDYWYEKLSRTARLDLPEKRVQEMMQAGFLHLDLICFGNEPLATVAPCVGVYSPIGTESTPVIQFIEAMGDQELGGRAAQFFLDKQHPDGYMQNYSDYQSETGLGLWNACRHYKYTHDKEWLGKNANRIVKSCDFLDRWASQLRDERYRRKGYGMIAGKVSDCHIFFPSFMMNATFYAGIRASAEVLAEIDHPDAARINKFADQYLIDIRDSFAEAVALSPVAPCSDGSWVPVIAEWPNSFGQPSLFADGGLTFTHGTMVETTVPGSYEMMYGIVMPDSTYARFITKAAAEYFTRENTGFSQPYYSVHPYGNLQRGEVGCFLKEFYNNMSSLADRETYSFWEHTFRVSPHKTHEEGWFLNRCRWMLYTWDKSAISFLTGVPRVWLEDGKKIFFDGMSTEFGKIALKVTTEYTQQIGVPGRGNDTYDSNSAGNDMRNEVSDVYGCAGMRGDCVFRAAFRLDAIDGTRPHIIKVRLPHPDGRKAVLCSKGTYDPVTETVTVNYPQGFAGSDEITLNF